MNPSPETNPAAEAREMIRQADRDDKGLMPRIRALLEDQREEAMLEFRRCPFGLYKRMMRILLPAAQAFITRTESGGTALARVGQTVWQPASQTPPPHLHLQPLLVWAEDRSDEPGEVCTEPTTSPGRWPTIAVYEASGWILPPAHKGQTVTHWRPVPICDPQPRELEPAPAFGKPDYSTADRDPIEEEAERYEQQ